MIPYNKMKFRIVEYFSRMFENPKIFRNYIMVVLFACILSGMLSYQYQKLWGVFQGCAWDGAFAWAMRSMLTAYVMTPIAMFFSMHMIRNDFTSVNVIRYKNRRKLWYKQSLELYGIALITIALDMIISFIVAHVYNGVWWNFSSTNSLFFWATKIMDVNFNIPIKILLVLFINSGEVYVVLMGGLLVYWLLDSKIITMLAILLFCYSENRYLHLLFTKSGWGDYYNELVDSKLYVSSLLRIIIGILIIMLISFFITGRKDFINGDKAEQ